MRAEQQRTRRGFLSRPLSASRRTTLVRLLMLYTLRVWFQAGIPCIFATQQMVSLCSRTLRATCLPVEVKSRCSPRTYDKETKQVEDVRRMLEDAGGLPVDGDDNRPLFAFFNVMIDTAADDDDTSGNSDSGERHYTVNPLLRAAIPDANELIQIMHHAVTWEVDSCFFVVGGYSRVLAIYEVRFPEELLDAYEDISSDLFDNDLKSLYLPSNEMPRLSDEWKQAIDSDSVKRLKLDEDSFLQRLAIWRVLNVDRSNDARKKRRIQYQRSIELPLPQTVTMASFL
mmetsp:Transcript_27030/g.61641  ORF Transcript_27030/g.61641 Transcript_27030/m.61641 type:complete len:285 (+) Transcript_27030:132-986(+)